MSDFDCCARQGGHDVPDPFDVALGGAIRENRRLRGEVAELQAVIMCAYNVRQQHVTGQTSWDWPEAYRILKRAAERIDAELRGTGTPTGDN